MDVHMRHALTTLESKLNYFLSSLTATPTAAAASAAAIELLNADDALTRALQTLRIHQQNYARILELRREARLLEVKVKDTVQEVVSLGQEIDVARCDREDDVTSEEEDEDEYEYGEQVEGDVEKPRDEPHGVDADTEMTGMEEGGDDTKTESQDKPPSQQFKQKKEIDYQLLLDFARRISRYNTEAVNAVSTAALPDIANLAKPQTPIPSPEPAALLSTAANAPATSEAQPQGTHPSHRLPPETKAWLDETSLWLQNMSKIPFPNEEKIRMGIMGRLQIAAVEGPDPESEVERMMAEAERQKKGDGKDEDIDRSIGLGASPTHAYMGEPGTGFDLQGGGVNGLGTRKPKQAFDLDLFDPDDEDA
ncbi:hypothetical protein KEM55_004698 [Ascosphaera atra]|nr:hypothetical protein KEM55_004698 [Ascosphaera atra]